MKDEEIVDLFFERSEQAITELSTKYGRLAYIVCNNILKNREDSEECVNDSFFLTWNAIPPFRPTSLKAYFINIVRNKALENYRYKASNKRNSNLDVALDELEEIFGSDSNPSVETEMKELHQAINRFLSKRKKQDRIIMVSRYYMAESVQDIAAKLEMTESAVSVKLHRTRKKLKNYLTKENLI